MSLFVIMGVSGCGKSSVAAELAKATGGKFLDADDFHPEANKKKMTEGIPLQDEDRWEWLDALNAELRSRKDNADHIFLACSALRQTYRDRLNVGLNSLTFIYLKGSKELIRSRMESRLDHFMPATLLDSQFASLAEPSDQEAIILTIDRPVKEIVSELLRSI